MMYKIMKQNNNETQHTSSNEENQNSAQSETQNDVQTSNQSENNHSTSTDASYTQTKEEPTNLNGSNVMNKHNQIIKVQIRRIKNKGTRHYIQHEYVLFL